MYLITCSDKCVYQHEGYCMLEVTTSVKNSLPGHCVHYINKDNAINAEENMNNFLGEGIKL